ncbi:MAG: flagellar basal-body rod protein FlgG [Pseudomonadota bacterium]|jgi:flagellar basal-body rod protein FlgG|nr:flagellar basal-body rod protein FlgG [Pseudomonadota bacterium]QKK04923.1 MAG: flagellar basal-body rod protein FlgG [Pseudomonadota bacterium]
MSITLSTGATGMLAQQLNVDVISNNIANMTTTGYKRQRAEFQDLLYQNKIRPGSTSSDAGTTVPAGIQLGLGVKTGSVYRINEQGPLQNTDNEFDLAIVGSGYFQITLPSGETAYTRDGSFQINENGEVVTSEGYLLEPSISVPDDAIDVTINGSGEVLVKIQGQVALSNLGQLELAVFQNPAGLEAVGDNLFMETEGSGAAVIGTPNTEGFGKLQQGALETSNVNVVQEITNLIQAQRAYEMNAKVIQAGDEMLSTINQLR